MASARRQLGRVGRFGADMAREAHQLEANVSNLLQEWDKLTPQKPSVIKLEGARHLLTGKHAGNYLRIVHDSACKLIVTLDKVHGIEDGECVSGIQAGDGALTIEAQDGVTINAPADVLDMFGKWSSFVLTKVGSNEWDFGGHV